MKPRVRREGLVVRSLADEMLVYDLERHHAHCLNRTAALVFERADGTRTIREIAGSLASGGRAEPIVEEALRLLARASLLEGEPVDPPRSSSRRDLLRKASVGAALLVPAIVSLVAPTPAQAASCAPLTSCPLYPDGTQVCGRPDCLCCSTVGGVPNTDPNGALCGSPPPTSCN